MKANTNLFWILSVFFLLSAIGYTIWSLLDPMHQRVEWVGTVAMTLCAVLAAFIGFYIGRVHGAQGGELPEDRLDANIDDGDAELGFFSPWSWWPLLLGASVAICFLGLAVGFWLTYCAIGLVLISLVGWVYEYYRGLFAR
ncbi:cytochrome c oxidase subunit 4 [Leifsonia sp. Leaf264]|uniref:cytochrome c oxidase subunit 4 n=1 Tax=Leifsonia sp. Leaf264 TaxID=1736314 RepID=UPI0006F51DD4|nr:cytochrome c oxidase subunit 4 [Leifsonia sp. Leaf264]KQP01112.1 cytochrome c oxidase subunit IV [Leifsonia sp. Leaf264]